MRQNVVVFSLLSAAAATAQVEVAVHLYDNAKTSQHLLAKATATADRIFAAAAITLRWQSCSPACVEDSTIPVFIIGIAGPQLEIPAQAALGFAMLGVGRGNRAVVSVPRIEDFAEFTATPLAVAMGHAIAHELGHLIARSNYHSTGIMTAKWGQDGAVRMRQGNLRFAPRDVEVMHKKLKANDAKAQRPVAAFK